MVRVRANWCLGAVLLSICVLAVPSLWQARAEEPVADNDGLTAAPNAIDPAQSACDNECICYPPRSPFYFRAEAIMLRRDPYHSTAAAFTPTGDLALSTGDLDQPFKAGPNFLVGYTFDDSPYQIEYSYFWLDNFNSAAAVRDPTSSLTTIFGDSESFVSISEFSTFQNMELNLRRQLPMLIPDRLTTSFLIGARFVGVREQYDFFSASDVAATTNTVNVRTRNELYGFQIGQEFDLNVDRQWWIHSQIKGAICNNSAGQDTVYAPTAGGVSGGRFDFSRTENGTSFIGDIAASLVCQPTAHVTTRLGYQAIWLTGMALASRNLNNDPNILVNGPPQINHRATVVYHGPFAGIEIYW